MSGYMPPAVTVEWATPQDLFDGLNEEFGFTVDVAATPENAKTRRFYTKEDDGLRQNWDGETVWCNPPYGKVIADWVKKAAGSRATVVMLLPARTDTRWFHDYVYNRAEIRFLKGRVRYGGLKYAAPFPSMVVIFRNAL